MLKNILTLIICVILIIPLATVFFLWWLFGGRIKLTWTNSGKVRYLRWFTIKEN